MSIGFDKALGLAGASLLVREQRAKLLAENLANVDTPGYKARDLDFKEALSSAQAGQSLELNQWVKYRIPLQPDTGDGNTVDSQVEKMAFAENALGYQTSLRFVNGRIQGLLKAIRGE